MQVRDDDRIVGEGGEGGGGERAILQKVSEIWLPKRQKNEIVPRAPVWYGLRALVTKSPGALGALKRRRGIDFAKIAEIRENLLNMASKKAKKRIFTQDSCVIRLKGADYLEPRGAKCVKNGAAASILRGHALAKDDCSVRDMIVVDFRCGKTVCSRHRNAEMHNCSYDFKGEGRRQLAKDFGSVSGCAPPQRLPKL